MRGGKRKKGIFGVCVEVIISDSACDKISPVFVQTRHGKGVAASETMEEMEEMGRRLAEVREELTLEMSRRLAAQKETLAERTRRYE